MEKSKIFILIGVTMMLVLGNYVLAQYETSPGERLEAKFYKMDIDKDGKVSCPEYLAYHQEVAEAKFTWIDVNGDGFVTRKEHKEGASEIVGEIGHTKRGAVY
jgi:Ca2+-binding EF-hand superfamily protein